VGLARLIARELGRPSRITGRVLNLANARGNKRAIELLDVSPEHRALEVGFGGGLALRKLAARARFVAGIDPSESAVRAARRSFRRDIEHGGVQVEEASVDAIPFEADSFDRALTVHTIYFWPDPERGLREILRVMKRGARFVLVTDTKGPPTAIAKHGFASYSEVQQAELLRSVGFSDIAFQRRGRLLLAVAKKP
jgi:ubiquinone/menaquinone biosynthesis C-methylase UbiE